MKKRQYAARAIQVRRMTKAATSESKAATASKAQETGKPAHKRAGIIIQRAIKMPVAKVRAHKGKKERWLFT